MKKSLFYLILIGLSTFSIYGEKITHQNDPENFKSRNSKMVIITTGSIQTASTKLTDFVTSKAQRGIDAQVVTESEWGGTVVTLRTWLQNTYQTSGIKYVLLIGHYSSDVPMTDFSQNGTSQGYFSDWPYAQLDGSDYTSDMTCEVHVGRIPVYDNDIATLDSILSKTIAYESENSGDIAWRKNALLCGPGFGSGQQMACYPLNAVHDNFIVTTQGWSSYRMYGSRHGTPIGDYDENVGQSTTAIQKIVAKWKTGPFGLVDFMTIGLATNAQDVITSSNTSEIGNQNPAFVFCGTGFSAAPANSDNLAYSLLKN